MVATVVLLTPSAHSKTFTPVALRCEYRVNPLGIDEAQPRLTWRIESPERGTQQTAYQILVASSASLLEANTGDLWDSGKISGGETVNIVYAGKPLMSSRSHVSGKFVSGTRPAKPVGASRRVGRWACSSRTIGRRITFRFATPRRFGRTRTKLFLPPAHQFRKEFSAAKTVKRATIYATALGIYELYLNGQRVGDARFAPGWTDYHQRAYYNTYDVTRWSSPAATRSARGSRMAGIPATSVSVCSTGIGTEHIGRYTYGKTPALMAQLEIEYTDGSREIIRHGQIVESHRRRARSAKGIF